MTDFGQALANLRTFGISNVAEGLSASQAERLSRHISCRGCFNSHVAVYSNGYPYSFHYAKTHFPVWCSNLQNVLLAPFFFDLVLRWTPLAAAYLETDEPRLYSLNAFWTQAAHEPIQRLQTYHRDGDDTRFLAMFTYGTDVLEDEDGPHCFMCGTQDPEFLPFDEKRIYGPAGSTFFADTRGLHMGLQPQRGTRLILWARWGVSERPWAYVNDKLSPVPREMLGIRNFGDKLERILELVVR